MIQQLCLRQCKSVFFLSSRRAFAPRRFLSSSYLLEFVMRQSWVGTLACFERESAFRILGKKEKTYVSALPAGLRTTYLWRSSTWRMSETFLFLSPCERATGAPVRSGDFSFSPWKIHVCLRSSQQTFFFPALLSILLTFFISYWRVKQHKHLFVLCYYYCFYDCFCDSGNTLLDWAVAAHVREPFRSLSFFFFAIITNTHTHTLIHARIALHSLPPFSSTCDYICRFSLFLFFLWVTSWLLFSHFLRVRGCVCVCEYCVLYFYFFSSFRFAASPIRISMCGFVETLRCCFFFPLDSFVLYSVFSHLYVCVRLRFAACFSLETQALLLEASHLA